jgi:hypothetical protein
MELGESWDMMGSSDIYCCSDSVSQKLDIAWQANKLLSFEPVS